jgi:hypothetical protein
VSQRGYAADGTGADHDHIESAAAAAHAAPSLFATA